MAEPAFYRCGACFHTWQRMEWKMHRNPPAECPHCGSADQHTDRAREDAYVREVYGPIAKVVGDAITKKVKGE